MTFLGKKHSKKWKKELSLRMIGNVFGLGNHGGLGQKRDNKFKAKRRKIMLGNKLNLGRKLSEEWKEKIRKSCIETFSKNRKKNPVTPFTKQIRRCWKYIQWRKKIYLRDNFTCVKCGKRGCYLEADHYPKLFSEIVKENNLKTLNDALNCKKLWSLKNGRTLCKPCHDKTKLGNPKLYVKS